MKLKHLAVAAALMVSGSAFAGATGNVGAFSEYLFRGIETSGGAAVQGGLDYSHASGLYAGTWASNTGGPASAGGTEIDLYGGYAVKVGPVGLDFGAIYYLYTEDEEDLASAIDFDADGDGPGDGEVGDVDFVADTSADYWEVYAKASYSYFVAQFFYTTDYLGKFNESFADALGKDTDAYYINLLANFPLSETLTLGLQYGITRGEGAEVAWSASGEETYEDYSISLTKTLDNGFAASFGIYDTTFKQGDGFGTVTNDDDGPKAVIGLKKTFDL